MLPVCEHHSPDRHERHAIICPDMQDIGTKSTRIGLFEAEPERPPDPHNFAFGSGVAALASLFKVTLPLALPSPKKMTSTVKSSLSYVSPQKSLLRSVRHTCIVLRMDSEA